VSRPSLFPRKVIAACLTGILFAIGFGVIGGNLFRRSESLFEFDLNQLQEIVPLTFLFSFPVILIYGTVSSAISDFIAGAVARGGVCYHGCSIVFHFLLGLILPTIGPIIAILFFVVDRLLSLRRDYGWLSSGIVLSATLVIWLLALGKT
jgi:hypothetical protein